MDYLRGLLGTDNELVYTDDVLINNSEQELNMAGGWSQDGAVQDQIDANLKDALELARSRIPVGKGLVHCEECDVAIPFAR